MEQYFTEETIQQLRTAIANRDGKELYFLGRPDEMGLISQVRMVGLAGPRSIMMLYNLPESGDSVILNHANRHLHPNGNDLQISRRFQNKGVGVLIINNNANAIYPLLEPHRDSYEPTPLDEEQMVALLGQEGPLAQHLESYEERPEQMEMLRRVVRSFNLDQILMVEAGTGTGKSLAYLLPAVYWAHQNRERVLVSTNTINLQEQIFLKDIPFLKKILDIPFEAALVKGRQNYLCLRKLHQQHAEPSLLDDPADRTSLQSLIRWAQKTETGDRSDLKYMPKPQLWSNLSADSDTCQRTRCEYYNSCFYYIARRTQAKANILITNHHILFADLALREATDNYQANALLPPYQRIVLDESHNIEDAASSFLGYQLTRVGISRALAMLLKTNRRKEEIGLLHQLAQNLANNIRFIPTANELRAEILEHLLPEVRTQQREATRTSEKLHQFLVAADETYNNQLVKIRITEHFQQQKTWTSLQELGRIWAHNLHDLAKRLARFGARIEKETKQVEKQYAGLLMDLTGAINRLGSAAETLELFFQTDDPTPEEQNEPLVRWIELTPADSTRLKLQAAPLEIGKAMERMMYDRFGSVALTSATLATSKDDFHYIAQRLGIDKIPESRVDSGRYSSPFDYKRQSLICIPTNIPSPQSPDFNPFMCDFLFEALRISGGRAFVLSTSFKQLQYFDDHLTPRLQQLGIRTLCQGKAQRHVLLEEKKRDATSVLFGTDSFWEGVDVQGNALNNVILTRLPFRVPSEPLIEARLEAIEARGGNSFLDYTVPAATIKFKQGFGRLIRSRSDRGTVLILDKRVVEKRYGQRFLDALPAESPRFVGSREQVLHQLQAFHHPENGTPNHESER